jgi:ElaB/YqjD/DUF883 family membrane-anchored ribosome-binding protein
MSDETAPDPATAAERAGAAKGASEPGEQRSTGERAREVQDAIEDSVHEIEQRYRDVRDQLQHANHQAVDFIRKHPATCIFGAVAVGYLVGRMASKRWLK